MSRVRTLIGLGAVAVLAALWLAPPDYLRPYFGGDGEVGIALPVKRTPAPKAETVEQGDPAEANPLHGVAIETFDEIIKRPLFNQTRAPRPEPVVAEEAEPVAEPQPEPVQQAEKINPQDFTLLAISIAGEERMAMIRWNKTSEVFSLRVGQYLSDWEVKAVEAKEVTIARADGELNIKLFAAPLEPLPPLAGIGTEEPVQAEDQ